MSLKRAILDVMRRDDLKAAVDAAGLEQVHRGRVQSMREAFGSAGGVVDRPDRRAGQGRVRTPGIDPTGRKKALIGRLVGRNLGRPLKIREGVAKYLAREVGELTVEQRKIEFKNASFHLSETKPFHWRRNLPPFAG